MNWADLQPVEGTDNPPMKIGRRIMVNPKTGATKACRRWSAIFCYRGRQRVVGFKTKYKGDAHKAAHDLHRKMQIGDALAKPIVLSVAELFERYIEMLANRGRSRKTTTKYKRVLADFTGVCEKGLSWKREPRTKTTSGATGNGASSAV